jgi:hypothetical protein
MRLPDVVGQTDSGAALQLVIQKQDQELNRVELMPTGLGRLHPVGCPLRQ